MGMTLDDIRLARPDVEVTRADWSEHCRVGELPPDLLSPGDHAAFHILVARLDGENVATAIAFDLGTDCGIFNVGTLEHARRRGLGTALTLAPSTTRSTVAAGRRACNRRRWLRGSMPPSVSGISAG